MTPLRYSLRGREGDLDMMDRLRDPYPLVGEVVQAPRRMTMGVSPLVVTSLVSAVPSITDLAAGGYEKRHREALAQIDRTADAAIEAARSQAGAQIAEAEAAARGQENIVKWAVLGALGLGVMGAVIALRRA